MCVISYGTRLQPYVTRSPSHFCVRNARILMRMRLPVTHGMRFRLAPSSPRMSMASSHGQGGLLPRTGWCKIALKYRTEIASVAGEENTGYYGCEREPFRTYVLDLAWFPRFHLVGRIPVRLSMTGMSDLRPLTPCE